MAEKIIGENQFTSGLTLIAITAGTDTYTFESVNAKPPGYQGSDAVKTTTNASNPLVTDGKVIRHEYKPGKFVSVTPATGVAAYDPSDEADIQAILQIEGSLKITVNTGESVTYSSAWLMKFDPAGKAVIDGEELLVADYEIFINAKAVYAAAPAQ